LDAISNLSDNLFPLQSKTLTGGVDWRLRVVSYRVVYTVSAGDITLFVVKIAHCKKNLQMIFTKRSQSHFFNADA
jgi:mRNA-degrading endonuclease RelE of RelBE toxin-antitoxin system